jgi:hypothetical protein
MDTIETPPEQADLSKQAPRLNRHTRGPLGMLTLVAFLGYDVMYFAAFFNALVAGLFVPPILVFAVVILLVAGVVATRWQWAPLVGAVVSLLTAAFVLPQPHNTYVLTHLVQPEFILLVLLSAFGLVALVAGVGATVQNYRGVRR